MCGSPAWSRGAPNGIAHAVNCAKELTGKDPFHKYLSDNLLKNGVGAIPKMMVAEKADCVISIMPVVEQHRYGIAKLPE